jgi:sugar phosphate isomerase/epimerase
MTRLSMNEMTTYRWRFEEDVANYAAAGIPAIGVWRQKLSDFGEEKGVELLAESNLAVSNLLWAGGFTGSDGRSYRESLEDAMDAVRVAADLRATALVIYSGARAGHTHKHARRLLKDALCALSPLAGEHNLMLAVEPMHCGCAAEWTFLNTLDDTLTLFSEVNSPHVKLTFDTYQLGQCPSIIEQIPKIVGDVAVVHLGDSKLRPDREQNRCRLGEGSLPLREIIAAFTAAGFDGYYDVELMGEEIEMSDYHSLLEHSKQAFSELCNHHAPS